MTAAQPGPTAARPPAHLPPAARPAATPPPASPHPTPSRPLPPHACVASLLSSELEKIVAALATLPPEVDLAEIRLDGLWPEVPDQEKAVDDLLGITAAATVPLLGTLRPKRQGGRFGGDEAVRLGLLSAAADAGFQYLDIELDAAVPGIPTELGRKAGLVFSMHEPSLEAPCRSDGLNALRAMQDLGGRFDKYAFHTGSFPDALRALEFIRAHVERGGRPSVAAMGYGGAQFRALGALVGNRATYGHAPALPPAVPGQPDVAEEIAAWRHWGLDAADLDHVASAPRPWLAVLGTPVAHSLSPRIHNAALRAAGRVERFGALDVPASASALRLVAHVAPRLALVGASVTAPHKGDALRIAEPDAVAKAVGAANCLRFAGGKVEATNTDATALERLLRPQVDAGDAALVLGAGGASRAVVWVLGRLGAKVTVTSRDETKGRSVLGAADGSTWSPWGQATGPFKVVVQATPLADGLPVAEEQLTDRPVVVEMRYVDGKTGLERQAEAAGCTVIAGRQVLLEQGADAYQYWFGEAADMGAMKAALALAPHAVAATTSGGPR